MPAVSVAPEAISIVPPEPASEATVSLPPIERRPVLTVSEAVSASVLAEVVATVPPPTTIAVEASVTPLAVVKAPELTVVVPAHNWLAFSCTAVFRPGATVKSTLACVAPVPSAVLSVRFVVVAVSLP